MTNMFRLGYMAKAASDGSDLYKAIPGMYAARAADAARRQGAVLSPEAKAIINRPREYRSTGIFTGGEEWQAPQISPEKDTGWTQGYTPSGTVYSVKAAPSANQIAAQNSLTKLKTNREAEIANLNSQLTSATEAANVPPAEEAAEQLYKAEMDKAKTELAAAVARAKGSPKNDDLAAEKAKSQSGYDIALEAYNASQARAQAAKAKAQEGIASAQSALDKYTQESLSKGQDLWQRAYGGRTSTFDPSAVAWNRPNQSLGTPGMFNAPASQPSSMFNTGMLAYNNTMAPDQFGYGSAPVFQPWPATGGFTPGSTPFRHPGRSIQPHNQFRPQWS